jgi:hypothetical protein
MDKLSIYRRLTVGVLTQFIFFFGGGGGQSEIMEFPNLPCGVQLSAHISTGSPYLHNVRF